MPQKEINVLIVPEGKHPYLKTIPDTLETLQEIVGGYIEPYDLKGGATIYCNEEGKIDGWRLNRAIRANDIQEDATDAQIVEMMAGTFLIAGFDPRTGNNKSLTVEQAAHWKHRFRNPEILVPDVEGGRWSVVEIVEA